MSAIDGRTDKVERSLCRAANGTIGELRERGNEGNAERTLPERESVWHRQRRDGDDGALFPPALQGASLPRVLAYAFPSHVT